MEDVVLLNVFSSLVVLGYAVVGAPVRFWTALGAKLFDSVVPKEPLFEPPPNNFSIIGIITCAAAIIAGHINYPPLYK
jgi:hypothetical protein